MMRSVWNDLKTMYAKPVVLACISAVFLVSFLSATEVGASKTTGDLLLQVLGGVRNGANYASYASAVPWLLMNLLLSGMILLYCNMEVNKRIYFVLSRFASYSQWWNIKFACVLFGSLAFAIVSVLLVAMTGCIHNGLTLSLTGEYVSATIDWLFPLYIVSICMFGMLLLFCFITTGSIKTTLILYFIALVVPITIGWILPDVSAWLFGNWGMLKRSSSIDSVYGFSPPFILPLELIIIVGLYFLGKTKPVLKNICYKASLQ